MGHDQTFDHTADLGLRIHASDLSDLFQTAAEALFDVSWLTAARSGRSTPWTFPWGQSPSRACC